MDVNLRARLALSTHPTITSDEPTGIAHDSDDILVSLLRTGQEVEDGEVYVLSPIMPYKTFSILSDKDAYDIVAWLRAMPAVENAVPERQLAAEPEAWTPASAPAARYPPSQLPVVNIWRNLPTAVVATHPRMKMAAPRPTCCSPVHHSVEISLLT